MGLVRCWFYMMMGRDEIGSKIRQHRNQKLKAVGDALVSCEKDGVSTAPFEPEQNINQ